AFRRSVTARREASTCVDSNCCTAGSGDASSIRCRRAYSGKRSSSASRQLASIAGALYTGTMTSTKDRCMGRWSTSLTPLVRQPDRAHLAGFAANHHRHFVGGEKTQALAVHGMQFEQVFARQQGAQIQLEAEPVAVRR